jgi:predicted nucleic-acid-binding Zn-ribbon protein
MFSCPKCQNKELIIRREVSYVYSYKIEADDKSIESKLSEYPYLFYNREILDSKDYIQCTKCGTQFPFSFENNSKDAKVTILKKAIRADNVKNPQYYG